MFDRISNMGRYAEPVAKAALKRILVRLALSPVHFVHQF